MTDVEFVREIAQPLSGDARDYDKLLELIGNARFVLLGEATHGTHEFYPERAAITKRTPQALFSRPPAGTVRCDHSFR